MLGLGVTKDWDLSVMIFRNYICLANLSCFCVTIHFEELVIAEMSLAK